MGTSQLAREPDVNTVTPWGIKGIWGNAANLQEGKKREDRVGHHVIQEKKGGIGGRPFKKMSRTEVRRIHNKGGGCQIHTPSGPC